MENEEVAGGKKFSHFRPILITVAVSCLSIPRYLNYPSSYKITSEFNGNFQLDDVKKILEVTKITYVAVGILSYVFYAWLFERCRRKTCLYFVCISQLATSILQLCTNSLWMLHVSKAFSAVSDVGAGMFCVIYVSEIAPDEIRGALVGIQHLVFSFNLFVTASMNLKDITYIYEYGSWISMYVSALVAIVTYAAVPESPIYFLRRDDITGAKHSFMYLHGNDKKVAGVVTNRSKILKATRSDSHTTASVFRECVSRRAVTFTCMFIALSFSRSSLCFLQPHLEEVLTIWRIFHMNVKTSDSILNLLFYLYFPKFLVEVLGNLLAVVLCDRIGLKTLLLISTFVCSISLIAAGIHVWDIHHDNMNKMGLISLVLFCIYIMSFNLGLNILPEVLLADIFPPKILNTQMAIVGSFHLCIEYVISYPIYLSLNPIRKMHVEFWVYGGLTFVVALLMIKFLSETKCRPPGFKFMDSEERISYSMLREAEE